MECWNGINAMEWNEWKLGMEWNRMLEKNIRT